LIVAPDVGLNRHRFHARALDLACEIFRLDAGFAVVDPPRR
jgi:hypothetical protein